MTQRGSCVVIIKVCLASSETIRVINLIALLDFINFLPNQRKVFE